MAGNAEQPGDLGSVESIPNDLGPAGRRDNLCRSPVTQPLRLRGVELADGIGVARQVLQKGVGNGLYHVQSCSGVLADTRDR